MVPYDRPTARATSWRVSAALTAGAAVTGDTWDTKNSWEQGARRAPNFQESRPAKAPLGAAFVQAETYNTAPPCPRPLFRFLAGRSFFTKASVCTTSLAARTYGMGIPEAYMFAKVARPPAETVLS